MPDDLQQIMNATVEKMQISMQRYSATLDAVDKQCESLGAGYHPALEPMAADIKTHRKLARTLLETHQAAFAARKPEATQEQFISLNLLMSASFEKLDGILQRWKPSITSVEKLVATVAGPEKEIHEHLELFNRCVAEIEKDPAQFMVTFRQKGFDAYRGPDEWSLTA